MLFKYNSLQGSTSCKLPLKDYCPSILISYSNLQYLAVYIRRGQAILHLINELMWICAAVLVVQCPKYAGRLKRYAIPL